MKIIITVPQDTSIVLPGSAASFDFLAGIELVDEGGYPRRLTPSKHGLIMRIVPDSELNPDSEINMARDTIEALRTQLGKAGKPTPTEPEVAF